MPAFQLQVSEQQALARFDTIDTAPQHAAIVYVPPHPEIGPLFAAKAVLVMQGGPCSGTLELAWPYSEDVE